MDLKLRRSTAVFSVLVFFFLFTASSGSSDYYQLLNVPKSATNREIKKSFRKLALKFHPDHNKEKDAEVKFREIVNAYEILSDDSKRKRYDQYGAGAFDGTGEARGSGGFTGDFNRDDFFRHFDSSFHAYSDGQNQQQRDKGSFKFKFGHHTFDFDDFWSDFGGDDFGSFFMHGPPHAHHGGGGFGFGGVPSMFGPMSDGIMHGFDHMAHSGAHFMGDMFGMGDAAADYYDNHFSPYAESHRSNHASSFHSSHSTHSASSGGKNCKTETKRVGSQVITTTTCQ